MWPMILLVVDENKFTCKNRLRSGPSTGACAERRGGARRLAAAAAGSSAHARRPPPRASAWVASAPWRMRGRSRCRAIAVPPAARALRVRPEDDVGTKATQSRSPEDGADAGARGRHPRHCSGSRGCRHSRAGAPTGAAAARLSPTARTCASSPLAAAPSRSRLQVEAGGGGDDADDEDATKCRRYAGRSSSAGETRQAAAPRARAAA